MPIMVLAAKICPKSVEATFYAFTTAVINLGYLLSYWSGGLLIWILNITGTDFTNLKWLIVVAAIFPILCLFMLLAVPNGDISKLVEEHFKAARDADGADSDGSQEPLVEPEEPPLGQAVNHDSMSSVKQESKDL